eukprot:UN33733
MECYVIPEINYLCIETILQKQHNLIMSRLHQKTDILTTYEGVSALDQNSKQIPGLTDDEFREGTRRKSNIDRMLLRLNAKMAQIINKLIQMPESEPFRKPVTVQQAPGYFDLVSHPMDLSKMMNNVNYHEYTSVKMFKTDFKLIVINCCKYNASSTEYVRMVKEMEKVFNELINSTFTSEEL